MTPLDEMQGTPFWLQQRVGFITGSRCHDAFARGADRQYYSKRNHYRDELIVERITGRPYPHRVTEEMQWGLDQEPFARAEYELSQEVMVDTCGFRKHPDVERFGASPDGQVGEEGLIQIKCPNTTTHLNWMLAGIAPKEYILQMVAEMACTGRDWCDFVSFDPRLPEHLRMFIYRFERDEQLIEKLLCEVTLFNTEIEERLSALPMQNPQNVVNILDYKNSDEVEI